MRARTCGMMALVVTLIAETNFGADSVNPKAIEGVWACVEAVNNGQKLPDEKASQLRLTLTDKQFKTQLGEQVLFDSTYSLDAMKTPVEIEMLGNEGDLTGKPALGIIKLDGGTLTLCYVMPGSERPNVFESQPGSKAILAVWKRAEGK
jgi:uncharacterized protein (TIGR03067 family)